jgi:hypothetical protein
LGWGGLPFSVAIFVRRFSEMGDMMRKIFVSATVAAVLCSLAISVAPALGLEFEGEATYSRTSSTTAQIVHLGTYLGNPRWVECAKMKTTAYPDVGPFTELEMTLEEYTTCSYNRELASEIVKPSMSCGITLESADLVELAEEEFGEGRAKFSCHLEFKNASGCKVEVEKSGGVAQPEYVWTNLDGESGHYESLIQLKLKNLEYRIKAVTGGVCKSSIIGTSTNGEYDGSIPVQYATIFPEF